MISDEMVEKAARAWANAPSEFASPFEFLGAGFKAGLRAALEAIESDLTSSARADGMEEACDRADNAFATLVISIPDLYGKPVNFCTQSTRKRILEIRQPKHGEG